VMNHQPSAFLPSNLAPLQARFGNRVKLGVALERFTSARVGGPADALIQVQSVDELEKTVNWLWSSRFPFHLLGGGSNVLVSDAGVRGVVVINEARKVIFDEGDDQHEPMVWAESGANFGMVSRLAAQRGFSGLEWAAGIPGTVGGAIFGNAGAHGSDMAKNLVVAEILQQMGIERRDRWDCEKFAFTYRSSILKTTRMKGINSPGLVILSAQLRLSRSTPEANQIIMDEYLSFRRRTQPPGASMGSMFKNPPGDFAGRLIEAAGLKGVKIGQAEISQLHGNFFINHGGASASEIHELIQLARKVVLDKFHINLELEIEVIGDW
jgi:UDP-N-acetylmuramate dehydrogenase